MHWIAQIHFLRPEWFYALLPLLLLLWFLWRQRLSSRSWQRVVAPRLLPYLLVGDSAGRRPWFLLATGVGGLLSVVAMAGPAWKKLEVPVFRQQSALVLLLDMSRSMDAADIKPSRLLRAQMKLRDILNQRKEGETALIVYAATPFVVSPLTPDARTIASQLDSMSTNLMPAQGSRPDRAIGMALQLLQQSGVNHGGVLLISDGIDGEPSQELKNAINELVGAGHRLSVLGVGTPDGAPIATASGFLKDRNGAIVLPRLHDAGLEAAARLGNGSYRRLSTDDSDFHALLAPFDSMRTQLQSKQAEGLNSDQWRDEGPWLLLPLLLLGALAFRRGYVLVLLLALPLPRAAHAFDWPSLWQRDDQLGQQAMQADNPKRAAALFKNPEWRAAANYRAGNYQAAADNLKDVDSADAFYNRGNALAKQGQLQEALGAYDEALKRDPNNADAKFNHDLVEEMLKQQSQSRADQNQKDQQQKKDGKDQQQRNGKDQNHDQQDRSEAKNGQNKPSESQSGSEQKSTRQDGKEGQQGDAKQQGGGDNNGKQANQAEHSKSADNAATGQEGTDNKGGPPDNAGQLSDAQKNSGENSGKTDPAVAGQKNANEFLQADKQWLRRIPDDPGGLWRRKFQYQYQKQQQTGKSEDETW